MPSIGEVCTKELERIVKAVEPGYSQALGAENAETRVWTCELVDAHAVGLTCALTGGTRSWKARGQRKMSGAMAARKRSLQDRPVERVVRPLKHGFAHHLGVALRDSNQCLSGARR